MPRNYNTQAFTPEQVENGELQDLLNYLLNFNGKSNKSFMDVHITSDGYCQIVDWSEVHYDFQYECGRFQFVDGDEEVYKGVTLPDNTTMYVPREEADSVLTDWLAEHPNWKRNFWGNWYEDCERGPSQEVPEQDPEDNADEQ